MVPSAPAAISVPAKSEPPAPKQEVSLIGAGARLQGTLAFSGSLVVNGIFSGKLQAAEGRVRIGPEGDVEADVEAADLQVEGKVRGGLFIRNSVELRKGADVRGTIRCLLLRIEQEAAFHGHCECHRPIPEKPETTLSRPDLYGFFTAVRVASIRL